MGADTVAIADRMRPRGLLGQAGLRSVFGKTLRDSLRGILIAVAFVALSVVATAAVLAIEFADLESRQQLVAQMELLPEVLRGLLGEPIRIDTLGGFVSWRIGNFLPVMLGVWSVLALSRTLAGEARRGSLDLLVATPLPRYRIALEKVLGHATAVAVAMLAAALVTWGSALAFATLPGDEVSLVAAVSHYLLTGLLMLAAGAVAFAAAPVLGSGRAAGLGLLMLFGGYLSVSYADAAPALDALRPLSWYAWTEAHRPLAGAWDWPPVLLLAGLTTGLVGIGALAFDRRDIGQTVGAGRFGLPGLPAGIGGPFARQLADRTGAALAWGLGIGLYAFVIAISAEGFMEALLQIEGMQEILRVLYPDLDLTQAAGVLQLVFFTFGSLLIGIAGATFLAGWATDEEERRLELVLSTPLTRARWALLSGLGVIAAIGVLVAVVAGAITAAIVSLGHDPSGPLLGMLVLWLFAAAVAGVGLAVGGLVRASLAAPVAGGLVVLSFLVDLIGNSLELPDWFVGLSLHQHLGQPMTGSADPVGLALFGVLAVGGLLLGTWGWTRRDVRG